MTCLLRDEPQQELGELGAVRRQQRAVQGAQQRRPRRPQLPRAAPAWRTSIASGILTLDTAVGISKSMRT